MTKLVLREAKTADSEFAYQTRKITFKDYIDQVYGWDEEEQRRLHQRRFITQKFFVIQWAGTDVGIIAMARESSCLRINQLFILPDYQGMGIGRTCMIKVMADADISKSPIRLKVLKVNRQAGAFFKKLGFNETGKTDTHILMEKIPDLSSV